MYKKNVFFLSYDTAVKHFTLVSLKLYCSICIQGGWLKTRRNKNALKVLLQFRLNLLI